MSSPRSWSPLRRMLVFLAFVTSVLTVASASAQDAAARKLQNPGLALTAHDGLMQLNPREATFSFTGPKFSVQGSIPAVIFAAFAQYPLCGPPPDTLPQRPCPPRTLVDLSVDIEFLDSVDYTIKGVDILSAVSSFPVLVKPVTTPALAPNLSTRIPFVLYIASELLEGTSLADIIVVGSGEATATFTSDAEGWHLQAVTYNITKHVSVDLP